MNVWTSFWTLKTKELVNFFWLKIGGGWTLRFSIFENTSFLFLCLLPFSVSYWRMYYQVDLMWLWKKWLYAIYTTRVHPCIEPCNVYITLLCVHNIYKSRRMKFKQQNSRKQQADIGSSNKVKWVLSYLKTASGNIKTKTVFYHRKPWGSMKPLPKNAWGQSQTLWSVQETFQSRHFCRAYFCWKQWHL